MFKVEVITRDDVKEYEHFVRNCQHGLVFHSIAWCNVVSAMGKDEPYFIVARKNGKIVGSLPLYLYRSEFGDILTTCAWYSVSGILHNSSFSNAMILKALIDHALSIAKELSCSAISISTHPFLDKDIEIYLQYFKPDYILQNFLQYSSLDDIFDEKGKLVSPDSASAKNIRKLRNLLKKYSSYVGKGRVVISDEQSQQNVNEFFKIYEKRMIEVKGQIIPKNIFDNILRFLVPDGKAKFLFTLCNDRVTSGSVFLISNRIVHVFMMAMDYNYRDFGCNYLTSWYMLKWAKENGFSIFDWMSSPKIGDGVYNWKAQWGSKVRTFWYLTRVLGDISQWRSISLKELMKVYSFHYVLPFNLLATPEKRFTTKNELAFFIKSAL